MRPAVAALLAAALAGCGSRGARAPGKPAGASCAAAGECQPELVCFEQACTAAPPASPACAPPGAPRIVLGGPVAATEPPPGTCVAPVRDTVLEGAQVQDLGELAVGSRARFEVPAGTSSVTIVSQVVPGTAVADVTFSGTRLPNTVVPTDVRLPDGRLLYDDLAPYPEVDGYDDVTGLLAYYGGATPISGAFSAPNTSAALDLVRTAGEVPAGTWSFTVNDWARECLSIGGCAGGSEAARYRVHVVTRPGPIASTGTLDLEVYLVTDPSGPLPDAAAAVASRQVARWVRGLSRLFAGAGACLGTVTFRDLPEWVRSRYAPGGVVDVSGAGMGLPPDQVSAGCDDLSQLFTAAVAPSRAVHVFLAEELVDRTGPALGTTLGVDGSIPGPSGFPGTVNGGAVVGLFGTFGAETKPGACDDDASTRFSCGTDVIAYVAAHEAGHWLGLYHTTEFDGTRFDPLADTPTCPCAQCVPTRQRNACAENGAASPRAVAASSCAQRTPAGCGGAQNLMFWQLDPATAVGELTREQGEVVRLNPAVH
ncbi:MAG TPA: hypothetical protein VFL83_10145 [Anaeromyxobacter sp.]|nr:hypothetical protein [Anaeromyxobacter sp.]